MIGFEKYVERRTDAILSTDDDRLVYVDTNKKGFYDILKYPAKKIEHKAFLDAVEKIATGDSI